MRSISKLQRLLLCAGLVLIVAALVGLPKYRAYREMQDLKAAFQVLTDVKNWPDDAVLKINGQELEPAEADRVRDAVEKLQFDGRFDEERWTTMHFTGSGMMEDGGDLWVTGKNVMWHLEASHDGSYVYQTQAGFAMTNGQELVRVLADLQEAYQK